MAFFQTSADVRILLLTSRGLSTFFWKNGELRPTGWFAADERGQEGFNRYLTVDAKVPLFLVADVIEEDFRLENVAHVLGKDRRGLLERKLAQLFRTAEFRGAQVQGRETEGRRDDKVLLSALTNNEQIAFWVESIVAQKCPFKGVLSVPWLLERLTGYWRQLDQVAHMLLVNIEQYSGLRQTYLQSGRLKFSRLTSLATIRVSTLAETIVAECSHTRQYLERLKLLSRDQPLDIHFVVQGEIGEEIGEGLADRPGLRFHVHETGVVAAELGFDPRLEDDQGVVFLALMQALCTKGLFNVYAPETARRYFRLGQIRKQIIAGTTIFFLAVLAAGLYLLVDGFKQRAVQARLDAEAQQFSRQHQTLKAEFPWTPLPAKAMENVVESVQLIREQTVYPLDIMGHISKALAGCPEIRLQRLDWQQVVADEGVGAENVAAPPEMEGDVAKEAAPALLLGMLAGKVRLSATLEGTVSPAGGHLAVQKSVERFIAALRAIPGMEVTPSVMPTETSPAASLQATLNGEAVKSDFSLQLVLQLRAPQ